MKIALIQSPVWGTYDPPLALAQLSACLRREGHEVLCLDINIDLYLKRAENYKNIWAWEQCLFWYNTEQVKKLFSDNRKMIEGYINKIINADARVICFSVNAASKASSTELAKELKSKKKEIIIVFGGPLFFERRFVDEILEEGVVDIVAPGEGELTICELAEFIEKGKDISRCPGLFFKKNGEIANSGERGLIQDLNTLPFLDFTDMPLTNYDDATHIPFMASRGCIQKCAFCSSKTFWPGYRCMSGERIFKEIEFHKKRRKIGHVDFLDLLLNGNMKSLVSFCELMIEANIDLYWTSNMIIRPEMGQEVMKKAKRAGCKHIIYGIESGSQRVLNLMHKHYKIEDADRVIRHTHEAGIIVTANFMFGFPGETEEDFKLTLDFLKRNAEFLDRVYPSRTFCAIEEYSYLSSHLDEFDIKPNPPNHLYWESVDGDNTYPERLSRCEEFCKLASSLGIEVGCGVQSSVELDKWYSLGNYYESRGDYENAIDCFLRYNQLDSANELISNKLKFYYKEIDSKNLSLALKEDFMYNFKKAVFSLNLVERGIIEPPKKEVKRLGRDKSVALSKSEMSFNSQLNDQEYEAKRAYLDSAPKIFFLDIPAPYNFNCIFSTKADKIEAFDLAAFRQWFEERVFFYIERSERITLTGGGEFFLLPEAEGILDYFYDSYPLVEKVFSTNGSSLTPQICERIAAGTCNFTIHVNLFASNSKLHKTLTNTDEYHKILGQLNYLLKIRNSTGNPKIFLVFIASILNIEDLPDFVKLASRLGVNKVLCYYNYIYTPAQKYLSCFFQQQLTNRIFTEAEQIAHNLGLSIELPPKFGIDYPASVVCRKPWSHFTFDIKGNVYPCHALKACNKALPQEWLNQIWNSSYYQNLRRSLIDGTAPCLKYCFHANPAAVNDFRSHIFQRGKEEEEIEKIDILWRDNF